MLLILGYILIFIAIYYRREENSIRLFSWDWILIILLVVFGTILVVEGHKKDQPAQKIQTEQVYESKNIQKT